MTGDCEPCIVFKPIKTVGGLERYLSELAITLNAPVYTPTQTERLPKTASGDRPEVVEFREKGQTWSLLNRLPAGAVISALEFEAFEVPRRYNCVISISEAAKAIIHHPHQRRVHLLNMPPRWLFDRGPGRYANTLGSVRWLMRLYQSLVRIHDISTISRIEDFVVPSEIIARRLETYYDRTASRIIYPPVDIDSYHFGSNAGYLLYLGRLDHAKRVVELIRALSGTEHQLKVAGTGPLEEKVRRAAGSNVEVLGYVSDQRKQELLANCDGLVFNSDREAFGMVPVEAMASGKPVIGINEGFTRHQIREGENGVLFSRGTENLLRAVERMYTIEWQPEVIQETADRYSVERFRDAWREFSVELID